MAESVYRSDPHAAPDSEFLAGGLEHLVAGNRGRLLDPRRTPVRIVSIYAEPGFFEVEIEAFEDAGARWLVPLESVTSYQFALGSATAGGADLEALQKAVARCDVQVSVTAGVAAQEDGLGRLAAERSRAGAWLTGNGLPLDFDPQRFIGSRHGWPAAQEWLSSYLGDRGLAEIEDAVASAWVSNPWSGDLLPRPRSPLLSVSFSPDVADSHFRSAAAPAAVLYRHRLVPERLFMTFLETAAMNRQFREAEAVVLAAGWLNCQSALNSGG